MATHEADCHREGRDKCLNMGIIGHIFRKSLLSCVVHMKSARNSCVKNEK